ncbi:MAG: hypothetical protein P9L92_05065 [Candidatus Electryonea clarkiae]|nr:hypothetical protein [Candidatus Electryonea clarkiae]MDP8287190.1 hypothetical protein [Candidatus Electryonea clarkiae]
MNKRKTDVFRLFQLLSEETTITLPDSIFSDLRYFIELVEGEGNINLKNIGIKKLSPEELFESLRTIYGLN